MQGWLGKAAQVSEQNQSGRRATFDVHDPKKQRIV